MPQTTATVTSCVKPVEELRSVEISFEDHEFYASQKLVASITHDDNLTQPWIVMVNGEEIHRANTFNLYSALHDVVHRLHNSVLIRVNKNTQKL